jgi:hypothetical protein
MDKHPYVYLMQRWIADLTSFATRPHLDHTK